MAHAKLHRTDPRDRMREVFARVAEKCDLPPLPAVAVRAMELLRRPDATADEMAKLVATDAAIAARVLRISRSAAYVRRQAPRTLQEAILTVGFGGLKTILLAAAVRSTYRTDDSVAQVLWEHALGTALAADELAALAGERRGGTSFLAGLLHDVGKLVLHISSPAEFARCGVADTSLEESLFGASHAAVGACLVEQWGLEEEIVEALLLHHTAPDGTLAARIATADRIADQIGFGSVAADRTSASLDLTDASLDECALRVADAFVSERSLFD